MTDRVADSKPVEHRLDPYGEATDKWMNEYAVCVCGDLWPCRESDEYDPLEDANGYDRSDLLFGGNW